MNFTLLSAKRFVSLCRFAKKNIIKSISVLPLISMVFISQPVHAVWNSVTGITGTPSSISVDPNNADSAFVSTSSGTIYKISSLSTGTPTAQPIVASGMNLTFASAIAVKPKLLSTDNDVILVGGSDSQGNRKVYLLSGAIGTTSYTAVDLAPVNTLNISGISQIVITKNGNAYIVNSAQPSGNESGIYQASNIGPTTQSVSWQPASQYKVDDLRAIETTSGSTTLVALVRTSSFLTAGIHTAIEGTSLNFTVATGLPNIGNGGYSVASFTINMSTVTPGAFVSVSGMGLYSCTLAGTSMSCLQTGITGTSNILDGMSTNSAGTLFGLHSTENALKSTTTGSSWSTHETTLPSGFLLPSLFTVSGSTALVATTTGIFASATNAVGIPSGGTTNGTDVEVQSVIAGSTSVRPSQAFNATVKIRNSGTQAIAAANVSVTVTGGTFSTPLPTGCVANGTTNATCNSLTTINTTGLTQDLIFPILAGAADGSTAVVTANITMTGGTDANTANNSKTLNVTVSSTATPTNLTGNVQPVFTGSQSINIDLSNSNPTSGVLSATDADGDIVTFSVITQPTKGTFAITNGTNWTYTPDTDLAETNGTDFVVLSMTDGKTAAKNVQILFSFQGEASSGGGAVHSLFVLFAMLGMMLMRRRALV